MDAVIFAEEGSRLDRIRSQMVIRSTSSSVISAPVRSLSLVVRGHRAVIACAFSSMPPASRYAVMQVARNPRQPEFHFEAALGCPVPLLFRGQSGPAPEQRDQNDDQQQAEALT